MSLGHTGRRTVVLGLTLNTPTLMNTGGHRKGFRQLYDFVLGRTPSRRGPRVAGGLRVGHPRLQTTGTESPVVNMLVAT